MGWTGALKSAVISPAMPFHRFCLINNWWIKVDATCSKIAMLSDVDSPVLGVHF